MWHVWGRGNRWTCILGLWSRSSDVANGQLKAPSLMANPSNFLDLFWCIMEAKLDQDLEAFATTTWFLWNNWNAIWHGKSNRTALQFFEALRLYLAKFQSHCDPPHPQPPHDPSLWRPTPLGWYKVNVDGVVFKELGHCRIGVVIQNDKGQIMGALRKTLLYSLGALEIEAKVAKIATIFSWELGIREIILKAVSQTVMNAIANHDPSPI